MRIFLLLALSSLLFLPCLIKKNFKPPPTYLPLAAHPQWDNAPSEEVLSILSQPFTYLARGNQATVFESRDGKYVLKLFRYRRPRFPISHAIKSWCAKRHRKTPKADLFTKMEKTLSAAHLALTEARPFTQVVYCHLNPTKNQLPTVPFHAQRTFHLPLDRYRFAIQKKVIPFKPALLAAKDNPEKIHRLIDSFIRLIHQRAAAGISNSDPNLSPNFGFLGEEAVEIDFGNYRKCSDPKESQAEIDRYLDRLEEWLSKNAPEYKLHINSSISYDPAKR